jgi:hypothetical protein
MKKRKGDVLKKMCVIQRQFGDAVIFTVGIKNKGKTIDIISANNTFSLKRNHQADLDAVEEMEFELPEKPDYIG